jgi:hypothetical protein
MRAKPRSDCHVGRLYRAKESRRQKYQSCDEFESPFNGNTHQAERKQEQPGDRVKRDCEDCERPAENKQ